MIEGDAHFKHDFTLSSIKQGIIVPGIKTDDEELPESANRGT
jgi:hypothetical protein